MLIDQIESSETSFEKAVVCRNVWVFSLWVWKRSEYQNRPNYHRRGGASGTTTPPAGEAASRYGYVLSLECRRWGCLG